MKHSSYPYTKSNSSVMKQMIINNLNIPDVLIDTIKDYLFYDKKTSIAREIKNEIQINIRKCILRRNDNEEDWFITNYCNLNTDNYWELFFIITAKNCFDCGEYILSSKNINPKIECQCIPDLFTVISDSIYNTDSDSDSEIDDIISIY